MASAGAEQPTSAAQSSPQQAAAGSRAENAQEALSSSPVEMKTLPPAVTAPATTTTTVQDSAPTTSAAAENAAPPTTEAITASSTSPVDASTAKLAPPAALTRAETEAIGPSTDTPAANPDNTNGPVVVIMLLLTTGARHPYKIDEKYLKKRSVVVEGMDPYNISVYTLKELIWRDWREEWEPRPTSPSSIRLIHFGRMLDDKSPLKDCRFQTENPNVVHMTVKPQEVVDEEDAKTGKGANRRDGEDEPTAGCRCVIL
ncbi:ubiquitin-related domain-containing protein [Paraphoma chrysanthemicola]|nr:ubiquitin-related domain-containing protein [Paraphoma chrysanthemicola]